MNDINIHISKDIAKKLTILNKYNNYNVIIYEAQPKTEFLLKWLFQWCTSCI